MKPAFNYVIGKPWKKGQNRLATYAYGKEVFYGDRVSAREMRDFIRGREKDDEYNIYIIGDEPLLIGKK